MQSTEFIPYGTAPIFAATTVSGIIFSFNAFQTVINMGSEVENSKRNIGRGITYPLLISGVIYILLQSTFITSLDPKMISSTGWHGINFSSPFADLAMLLGIHWLSVLLYMDAFISPFGTGVSFVASSSRTLAAMVSNNHIPKFLGTINKKYRTPRVAMLINAVLSMLMVSIFRSWETLASVISTSTLIAYLTGPVTVISLRKMAPEFTRPFRGKILKFMAPLSFVLASLATYWAMWPTTIEVILVILLGIPLYVYYEWRSGFNKTKKAFAGCFLMIGYLIFISAMSFIGSTEFNGQGWIHYPFDFAVIIIGSLGFYYWGTVSHVMTKYFKQAQNVNSKVKIKK